MSYRIIVLFVFGWQRTGNKTVNIVNINAELINCNDTILLLKYTDIYFFNSQIK